MGVHLGSDQYCRGESPVRGNEGRADRSLGTLGSGWSGSGQHRAPGRRFSLERTTPGPVLITHSVHRTVTIVSSPAASIGPSITRSFARSFVRSFTGSV